MKTYLEFLQEYKPVCFINFDYDLGKDQGFTMNIGEIMRSEFPNAEFYKNTEIALYNDKVLAGQKPLEEFSLIFFGPVGEQYKNFTLVENYCKEKMIPFLPYGSPSYKNNKFLQPQLFNKNRLPYPQTLTGIAKAIDLDFIENKFELPIVLKQAHSSQGKGVELIDNKTELQKRLEELNEESVIIQNKIPNSGDYRIYFLGEDFIFAVKRTPKKGEFRSNISLGGSWKRCTLPVEPLNIARKAHRAMNFYASGVDLMQCKKCKKWYILEVNSAPQFSMSKNTTKNVLKLIANDIKKLRR